MSGARRNVVVVACALALAGCAGPAAQDASGRSSTPPSPTPTSGSASPGAGASQTTPASPRTSTDTGTPEAEAESIEVPSPEPTGATLPGLTPAPSRDEPLIRRPLPRTAAARGRLVDGYPARVLPPARGTDIATSSVTASGGRLQVALTGETSRSTDAVLLFYRLHLTGLGFGEVRRPASGQGMEVSFRRGRDSATLSVRATDAATWYALFSTLHAG